MPASPKLNTAATGEGLLSIDERDPCDPHGRAGRQLGADRYRHDRRVLRAVRRFESDDAGAIGHRAVVEDVGDEVRPGVVLLLLRMRAAAEGDRSIRRREVSSASWSSLSKWSYRDRPEAPQLRNAGSYSHSSSAKAAVTFRAWNSSKSSSASRSSCATSAGASSILPPSAISRAYRRCDRERYRRCRR